MAKILAVSDPHVPKDAFLLDLNSLSQEHEVQLIELDYKRRSSQPSLSERSLSEYWGSPSQLIEEIDDSEILIVHRAPVTSEVMKSSWSRAQPGSAAYMFLISFLAQLSARGTCWRFGSVQDDRPVSVVVTQKLGRTRVSILPSMPFLGFRNS